MNFKLIACDVLTREVCYCVARTPHSVSLVFTAKGEHNIPGKLQGRLQDIIDQAAEEETAYDAVLLGFGLCGNATIGLEARGAPLVIPRAHDCTTLFLGSKQAFEEHFGGNPSQMWASGGYSERGDSVLSDDRTRAHLGAGASYEELVKQYGEENAAYLVAALRTEHGSDEVFLLDVPETRMLQLTERIHESAVAAGKRVRVIPGSIRLIERLLAGGWSEDEFLIVPPGRRIAGVYDLDRVIAVEP